MTQFLIIALGAVGFGVMIIWAVGALRSMRRGGSGLPFLALPDALPGATRRAPVVCLGHNDHDQPPVTGNGGLWMDGQTVMFHSAAGTLTMSRPLRFAQSTTSVADLDIASTDGEPFLALGFTSTSGHDAVAAFRTADATGWAIALTS